MFAEKKEIVQNVTPLSAPILDVTVMVSHRMQI